MFSNQTTEIPTTIFFVAAITTIFIPVTFFVGWDAFRSAAITTLKATCSWRNDRSR